MFWCILTLGWFKHVESLHADRITDRFGGDYDSFDHSHVVSCGRGQAIETNTGSVQLEKHKSRRRELCVCSKTMTQSHLDLNDLVNSGYLTSTEDFQRRYQFSASRTNDSFEATVTYDGDVDIERLKSILPEATKINDVLKYPFTIPICW